MTLDQFQFRENTTQNTKYNIEHGHRDDAYNTGNEPRYNTDVRHWDEKYNTDLILAQIDPSGMSKLEKTDTYSDVDYVPSIVVLQNGKKVAEYNGPKNKDNMIEFLLKGKYLNNKMKGGSKTIKRRKNTRRKSKNTRRKRKNTRRNKKGSGSSMSSEHMSTSSNNNINKKINVVNRDKDDFNFVENEKWLKPFLIKQFYFQVA